MNSDPLRDGLKKAFEDSRKEYCFTDRENAGFIHKFWVDIDLLLKYFIVNPHLRQFIPLITEIAEDPYEIWQMFQENKKTGQVRLQHWFVKAMNLDEGSHGFVLVFEAEKGANESVEFLAFHGVDWSDSLNRYRRGKLIYARDN